MENLNIALVHEWITNLAGAERVLLELKKIFPKAPIYTAIYDKSKVKAFDQFDVKTSFLQRFPFAKSKREVLIPFTPLVFEQFDFSEYDLVITSSTMAAKGIITKPDTAHICYCHTPPRYLWEPELDPRAKKGHFKSLRQNTIHQMRIWDRLAADRVDEFIANSKYVANRIKKYYGRNAAVVYPGVDVEKFRPVDVESIKDYFLFVSRLVDYKRCDIVIDAFNKLGLPLKVIGKGPERSGLMNKAKENIQFLGYLSDEDMTKYYREAKAFIFAAEEDFGIVPLEAMACGRPVIAFAKGGAAETIVDGVTGVFFDEQSGDSLAAAISGFVPEKFDPKVIRKHAENFSTERFREEFYQKVAQLYQKIKEERE